MGITNGNPTPKRTKAPSAKAARRLEAALEALIVKLKSGTFRANPYMNSEFKEAVKAVSFARTGQDGEGYDILTGEAAK